MLLVSLVRLRISYQQPISFLFNVSHRYLGSFFSRIRNQSVVLGRWFRCGQAGCVVRYKTVQGVGQWYCMVRAVVMESTMRSLQLLKTRNYRESDQLVLAFELQSWNPVEQTALSPFLFCKWNINCNNT